MRISSNTFRRDFIKLCGLSALPFFMPENVFAIQKQETKEEIKNKKPLLNFISDGLLLSPAEYLQKLDEINKKSEIEPDFYGNGGATKRLEDAFVKITGKEKAIFLPTGTMANQLAIKLLNKDNTKALVPENSHIYRDEADAAQSVHNKRLIGLGKGKPFFTLKDLQETLAYYDNEEVFKSGLGVVAIENPIRRADASTIPIENIKEISKFCKEKGYQLHLDGARLHIAAAYTGVSIAEYATNFDTVYISLYKHLNATNGAILCGKADIIDKVAHQIKIYGGTSFQNWSATAVALHSLNDVEEKWKNIIKVADYLVVELNKIPEIKISKIENGTNIYNLVLDKNISLKKLADFLRIDDNILVGRANAEKVIKLMVNESLLSRKPSEIVDAWKKAIINVKK